MTAERRIAPFRHVDEREFTARPIGRFVQIATRSIAIGISDVGDGSTRCVLASLDERPACRLTDERKGARPHGSILGGPAPVSSLA